jgi:two-component sensor histidine kinase
MKKWIFTFYILVSMLGYSQNHARIDSLETELNNSTESTQKANITIELSKLYGTKSEGELYAKTALDFAKKTKDTTLLITALQNASQWYTLNKNYQSSISYLAQISEIYNSTNDQIGLATNLYHIGGVHRKANQLDLAIDSYQKSILLLEQTKEYEILCKALNKIGVTHKDIGNYPEALKNYHKAYDIAVKHSLDNQLASTCINMGVIFKRQKNYRAALNYYEISKEIHSRTNNYSGLANVYNNIGNIHRNIDELDSALIDYKTAIIYRKKSGTEKMLSYSYNNMAITFTDKKMYDSSLFYLAISEKYKLKNETKADLASTYLNYAEVYMHLLDTVNFYKYYEQGMAIASEYKDTYVVSILLTDKSKVQAQFGQYQDAYANLLQVIEQLNDDKIDKKQQQVITSVLNAQFKDKRKTRKINNLAEANEVLIEQNTEIKLQKDTLKHKDQLSFYLIIALVGCAVFLVTMLQILFNKNKKLANNAAIIEKANKDLSLSKVSIEEKETLLKEVHHRVKNNLQIIKSLVRLQKNNVSDLTTKNILSEFELRVSSMALVHESLYKSNDLSKVNINAYYEKLVHSLIEAYSLGQSIETDMNIEVVSLELDTLIPLGLLTNEIISNALKHGVKNTNNGILTVNFYLKKEHYYLYISDNGPGFPNDLEEKMDNSLGMELIEALVQQLDGEMKRSSHLGAEYNIKFKKTK